MCVKNSRIVTSVVCMLGIVSSTVALTATAYPKFSADELNQAASNVVVEESAADATADDPANDASNTLRYREDVAVLYQHLPEDPIHTYGTDPSGRGECTGTACPQLAKIWDKFAERQSQGKSLIILEEDERKGKIVMPEAFAQDVKNQPAIQPQADTCPAGYTYVAQGNAYSSGVHCGMLQGNTYYVADVQ